MDHTKRPTQYKRAREFAGLSLSQASRLMEVDLRELANIENGDIEHNLIQNTLQWDSYYEMWKLSLTLPYFEEVENTD